MDGCEAGDDVRSGRADKETGYVSRSSRSEFSIRVTRTDKIRNDHINMYLDMQSKLKRQKCWENPLCWRESRKRKNN